MNIFLRAATAVLLVFTLAGPASAQDTEYVYGKVAGSDGEVIVVIEMVPEDLAGDIEAQEFEIVITEETEIENLDPDTEVVEGMEVDVEYVSEGGVNRAEYIYIIREE
ncbi:MAG: hypothetical protein GF408_04125 [Candidatus Omnitrophica bacterium]|nr:hypothetical protein [Candidatus Omnitrophota bacterium]